MAQFNPLQAHDGHAASPTMEQLLRAEGDSSRWASATHTSALGKEVHDPEEDVDHHHKKSVFMKVKEKARKLKHSLSGKKKHSEEDENSTPSWGYNLEEDDEDDDIDAEYLGAPMYESELAPEECRENARQHPRADPVIADTHILATPTSDQDDNPPITSSDPPSQISATDQPSTETAPPNEAAMPKTLTQTVSQKLSPVYSTVTEATHAIASKLHSLAVADPASPSAHSSPAAPFDGGRDKIWDKGVSVKEYLMHKFEPGEDERALSQVLSEAMSPRRRPGDSGVVEKVREAVTCMLRAEETPQPPPAKHSSNAPIYNDTHQVAEEETLERILQAN